MANEVAVQKKQSMGSWLGTDAVKSQILSVVGEKDAQSFISAVVSAVQTNPQLAECTNSSILSAALVGQSLKLPHSPHLGFYWLVPFDVKRKDANGREYKQKEASFQLAYKGYLQLAMRTGEYKKIVVTSIKEGEFEKYDPIAEEYVFKPIVSFEEREKANTIGYYAYFVMNNGYRKELYWTKEKMEAHAKKYSASYRSNNKWVRDNCLWSTSFDDMAYKTMIRQLISKWGIMSTELQNAYVNDYATIDEEGRPHYLDNVPDDPVPAKDVLADVVEGEAMEVVENGEEKKPDFD